MKTEKNILVAFILNIVFSIFEFVGGTICGSVAIISDSIHDMGDAMIIGVSYFLEKMSKRKPDEQHTYGYIRYSVMGSVITTIILLLGSGMVILNAINRIVNPVEIHYDGMIAFAVVGAFVNFWAAYFTREGDSLNQKAVNLHMLEDVLGWVVVLIGAIIMRFTDIAVLDPIMSICVAVFIFINAFKNLKEVLDLFLEKAPYGISVDEIKHHIMEIDGVLDVHHIHIRSLDGYSNSATMHIVTDTDGKEIKAKIKDELKEHGINHVTLELEASDEKCDDLHCLERLNHKSERHHHHHHHH